MADNNFVIDSNTLVSGFVFKSKKPSDVLRHCLSKGKIIVSSDLLEEHRAVLLDEKFEPFLPKATREAALSLFVSNCELAIPNEKIVACRDASDNKILELAVAAKAVCIITGDKDLLELHPFRGIPILSPSDFLSST